jgi:phosphoserine phosphatase RsbU/P
VQLDLLPGDSLTLFTDGVTEGRRGHAFYGDERLARVVGIGAADTRADAGTIADAVLDDVLEFQLGNPSDDIAIVVVAAEMGES